MRANVSHIFLERRRSTQVSVGYGVNQMDRPRILRLLRIAFSAGCGIVCLLLIVLWVRSYGHIDRIHVHRIRMAMSWNGGLWFGDGEFDVSKVHSKSRYDIGSVSFRTYVADYEWVGGGQRIPYWLLVTIPISLAAVSWLPWRFSLRTLLLITTLAAVLLGAIVYAIR